MTDDLNSNQEQELHEEQVVDSLNEKESMDEDSEESSSIKSPSNHEPDLPVSMKKRVFYLLGILGVLTLSILPIYYNAGIHYEHIRSKDAIEELQANGFHRFIVVTDSGTVEGYRAYMSEEKTNGVQLSECLLKGNHPVNQLQKWLLNEDNVYFLKGRWIESQDIPMDRKVLEVSQWFLISPVHRRNIKGPWYAFYPNEGLLTYDYLSPTSR